MRIKSKFKDYYDGVNPLYSQEPVFVRNTVEHKLSITMQGGMRQWSIDDNSKMKDLALYVQDLPYPNMGFSVCRLYFCGRVYTAVRYHDWEGQHPVIKFYWKPCQELHDRIFAKKKNHQGMSIDKLMEKQLAGQGRLDKQLLDLQMKAAAPIILDVHENWDWTLIENPKLSTIDFPKIVDPQQAWQELAMFFGNLVMPERATINISDKDRHAQHGFDAKSFRRTAKELKGK